MLLNSHLWDGACTPGTYNSLACSHLVFVGSLAIAAMQSVFMSEPRSAGYQAMLSQSD